MRRYQKWLSLGLLALTPGVTLAGALDSQQLKQSTSANPSLAKSADKSKGATNQDLANKIAASMRKARLNGFDIQIRPLANLVRSGRHCVYGIVAPATHEQLRRLYSQDWVGTYLPEAVLVETPDGTLRPALCFIAPSPEERPAADDYIDRIVGPARKYGFPDWYVARLESFRPR